MSWKSKLFVLVLGALLNTTAAAANESLPVLGKHGVVAYTWNSNPSDDTSLLSTSAYTFNYGRPVTRTRP